MEERSVEIEETIRVPPGHHRLSVEVRNRSIDAQASIDAELAEGGTRELSVDLNPLTRKLALAWRE